MTAIAGFFAQLGDKSEWAVKALLDRKLAAEKTQPALEHAGSSPGKNYLQKKRDEAESGALRGQWLRAACEKVAGELEQHASEFRERELWNRSDSGAASEVIVNWAFLVSGSGEADFRRLVTEFDEQHRARGLSFALSGPWPPYSFAPALGKETAVRARTA